MNKTALITGASRGLGKEMALKIAEKGIDVIITYRSNAQQAEEVVKAVQSMGRQAKAFSLDTTQTDSFNTFFEKVSAYLKEAKGTESFDFLINNAGTGYSSPVVETKEDAFESLFNVHMKGVYFFTQQAIGKLNTDGRIINISSGLARFAIPGYSAYAMMKGGIEVFSRYLAKELGEKGIAVNTVAPGAIETDFEGGTVRDNPHVNQHIANMTALGRVGLPTDIGGVVAFLCTEDAGWINAQRIEVSGGMSL